MSFTKNLFKSTFGMSFELIINTSKYSIMWQYGDHHFWGMHLLWWIFWGVFIFWVFVTAYDVPGQRKRKDTPLDIIKKRFSAGEIDVEEFTRRKEKLEIGKGVE
jgi:putative membrane protein